MVRVWFFTQDAPGQVSPLGNASWDGERVRFTPQVPQILRGVARDETGAELTPADGEAYVQALPQTYQGTYLWAEQEPEEDEHSRRYDDVIDQPGIGF